MKRTAVMLPALAMIAAGGAGGAVANTPASEAHASRAEPVHHVIATTHVAHPRHDAAVVVRHEPRHWPDHRLTKQAGGTAVQRLDGEASDVGEIGANVPVHATGP